MADSNLPKMFLIRRRPTHKLVEDPAAAAAEEMDRLLASTAVQHGDRVAVACGSRGIHHIDRIAAAAVRKLTQAGARPFVFPAMGCHGGGTGAGQKSTLEHLGITEEVLGCPIVSEIDPDRIGSTQDGVPVYLDKNARKADHLLVINRVKPHSDFFGTIGSGLLKMLVIGCGKMKGADTTHEAAIEHGLEHMLRTVSAEVLRQIPVLGGLGVIEGPTGLIADIEAVPAEQMTDTEPRLFKRACSLAPAMPVSKANLLLIDEMGKNISGCGMDPFVIGRQEYLNVHDSYTDFRADRVYVSDLTEQSLGNADGVGMADATSDRLVAKLDYDAIRIGVLTSRTLPLGRIPISFATDREAVQALLGTTSASREEATVIRARNTTELEYVQVSENLVAEVERMGGVEVTGGPFEMKFDREGWLLPQGEST